ncbi:MAG: TIM-barrel domain-containing protein [Haloarculaceae archaeon]
MTLPDRLVPAFEPVAREAATVAGERYRFSVLTPRVVRLEYTPDGEFEDRPSQAFWYRDRPVPEFDVTRSDDGLVVETDALRLEYAPEEPFGPETLSATIGGTGTTWRYGDTDEANLGGTVRTLDRVEGSTDLSDGLLARDGWAVVEDTGSLVFGEDGWVEPRGAADGYEDVYLFGYGHDYLDCLADFAALAGDVPMVPRWALGNWWSRYEAYSAEDLRELLERFRGTDLPLSVCVIDMDWHVTDTEHHDGWTGWTWNRELFPDPPGFLDWLHDRGLRTTLNLHPAEGVHPHENAYRPLAEHAGIDPESGEPVEFDASDARFLEGYFEHVLHPLEADGVDFWWIDWQQWAESPGLARLDPLWALNHLHALDRARDGRRPFVLSRWGGLGGHRSPVGFSGDTYVSWGSLAFQPYLTATAGNVGSGWWSHDIGGHFGGTGTPEGFGELYARWTQFGALSPVNRIHTSKVEYVDKRPWTYPPTVREALGEALRFRHALVPYLYTMARRYHEAAVPPVRPTYYHHPEADPAYQFPGQYYLGSELLAAPHTRPREEGTNLARRSVWLPEGDWFDFHTGERYDAGVHARYGDLSDVPLYAPAGAVVPLDADPAFGDVDPPERLRILAFPGADGSFDLYEDDGVSQAHREGAYATTTLAQRWAGDRLTFTVGAAAGDTTHVPDVRDVALHLRGLRGDVTVEVDGAASDYEYRGATDTVVVALSDRSTDEAVTVTVSTDADSLLADAGDGGAERRLERVRTLLRHLEVPVRAKSPLDSHAAAFLAGDEEGLGWLAGFAEVLSGEQARAVVETLCDVGVAHLDDAEDERLVLWNGDGRTDVTYRLTTFPRGGVPLASEGTARGGRLPELEVVELDELVGSDWTLTVDYAGAGSVSFEGEGEADRYEGDVR